jgi:hypothetical protein
MDQHEIGYAISKQVPDIMAHAQFETNYGTLYFDGKDAERIAAVVRKILERKLAQLDKHDNRRPAGASP